MSDSLAARARRAGVEPDHPWPRHGHRPAPPDAPPSPGYVPVPPPGPVTLTPPHGGTGATDPACYVPRHEQNAVIIERIVVDRVNQAHLLRCIVQGCYRKAPGEACAYCGTVR